MRKSANIGGRLAGGVLVAAMVGAPGVASAAEPEGPRAPPVVPVFPEDEVSADTGETAQRWQEKRRKLRIQLGVSAGFTAAFVAIGALVLTVPCADPSPEWGCGEPYGRWITAMTVFPAAVVAAIPTAVYGVRLYRHNQARPVALFQPAPGGFALRF